MRIDTIWVGAVVAAGMIGNVWAQGSLNPPGAPDATMKTLEQVEPRTPISSLPYTISKSGSYYLTTDLTGGAGQNGISVNADEVTIDLNGFTLAGPSSSVATGIYQSSDYRNLRVHNGKVVNWKGGNHAGINARGENNKFENVQVSGNNLGISSGYGSSIRDCSAYKNESHGFFGSLNASISKCVSFYNSGSGFWVYDGSSISDCNAYSNKVNGIRASVGVTVRDCSAKFNKSDNIMVESNCFVENNHCTGSIYGAGIHVLYEPEYEVYGEHCRIDSNVLVDNYTGLRVQGQNNLIVRNSAGGNDINYEIAAGNKVGKIISPPDSAAISGDSGGGFGTTFADAVFRPWVNFVIDAADAQ